MGPLNQYVTVTQRIHNLAHPFRCTKAVKATRESSKVSTNETHRSRRAYYLPCFPNRVVALTIHVIFKSSFPLLEKSSTGFLANVKN